MRSGVSGWNSPPAPMPSAETAGEVGSVGGSTPAVATPSLATTTSRLIHVRARRGGDCNPFVIYERRMERRSFVVIGSDQAELEENFSVEIRRFGEGRCDRARFDEL